MRKIFNSTVLALLIGLFCVGSIAYAEFGVQHAGQQFGVASIFDVGNGVNWTFDGFILFDHGVNWSNITGLNLSNVNWVGANILASTGINWEQLRVSNGNTSTSVNWQAFGV